jgi:hypothetical protein
MPTQKRKEEPSINEEDEALSRADWEQQFQSRVPRFSDQALIVANLAEPLKRALGLHEEKIPADLANTLQTLREQISDRKPSALDESRVPPSGVAPTEE